MKLSNFFLTTLFIAGFSGITFAGPEAFHSEKGVIDPCEPYWDCSRPDSHAPIGVMGEHTHHAGEWMTSYRYMVMNMAGMRSGTDSLAAEDVFALGFPVSPTKMSMEMHMIGLMFAPTDAITLFAMTNLLSIEMEHVTRAGTMPRRLRGERFTAATEDWGDTKFGALIKFHDCKLHRAHLNIGVSAPTGTIDAEDPGPLPYPMQTGSGTWDLLAGATWLGQDRSGMWSYGAQGLGTIRLGENDADYTLSDRVEASLWLARLLGDHLSVSGRLGWSWNDEIDGADPRLNPRMVPTAVPGNYERQRLDASLGVNWYGPNGNRFAVEAGVPLYEEISGPLLETDYWLTVGWQKAW